VPQDGRFYSATLSPKARLLTYGVGLGVGLGVPLALAIGFTLGFGDPAFLLLPLPFAGALLLAWLFRTTGYRVGPDAVAILSPVSAVPVKLSALDSVRFPASSPPGNVFGLWRVEGIWGTRGSYWNRSWGKFRVYVTDDSKRVELRLAEGGRILVSPDRPEDFAREVSSLLSRAC
jgi:hypothetical protein